MNFRAGDIVKILYTTSYSKFSMDKTYVVCKTSDSQHTGVSFNNDDNDFWEYNWEYIDNSNLELIKESSLPEFDSLIKGDEIKIIRSIHGHNLEIGKTYVIGFLDHHDNSFKVENDYDGLWIYEGEWQMADTLVDMFPIY